MTFISQERIGSLEKTRGYQYVWPRIGPASVDFLGKKNIDDRQFVYLPRLWVSSIVSVQPPSLLADCFAQSTARRSATCGPALV
jgi:hypothetical protein